MQSFFIPSIPAMRRCLELASLGRGHVGNAPLVGSVLVRDEAIIAEGYYEGFGKLHAERSLLQKFDQKISSEDVLYVNLEPCCHHGKTPPCTDILLERGVKNVVCGMVDPDTRVAGKGIEILRAHGVNVICPFLHSQCAYLNRGFISVRTRLRPWITLKRAQTRDGRIANPDGSKMKITDETQDALAHKHLRAKHDAILVGVNTILTDNPQLDTRFIQNNSLVYRIILDPHFKIPESANVVSPSLASRTIIVTANILEELQAKKAALTQRGVRILELPFDGQIFDWQALFNALMTPNDEYHGITSILVEGGPKTWELFSRSGYRDEEVVLVGN